MITEQDILNTIEKMREHPVPTPKIELTPEQFEALRKLPVKSIPMDFSNHILGVEVVVKDEMVPSDLFGTCQRSPFIDDSFYEENEYF